MQQADSRNTRLASIGISYAALPWGQLSLTAIVACVVTGAMLSFGPLVPEVRADLGLSNTWAGLITSATVFAHTLLQLPSGHITDSLGAKRTIAVGITVVGIGVLASGLAPSLPVLFLARLLVGVGTATGFVAGLTYTAALVPAEQRVMAQSVYGAAGSAGVLLVLLVSERLSALDGWRVALVAEGLAFLLVGWLVVARLRDNRSHSVQPALSWGETLREAPLWLLGLAHLVTYGAFVGVTSWVVTFLWERHGVGLEWAGPLSALLACGAIVGRLVGGPFSIGRQRAVIIWSCFIAAASLACAPLAPTLPLALLALVVFGWFLSVPFGAVFTYASLVSGRSASGRELSLINGTANLGALAFPPLVGLALDYTGSYALGFGVLAAIGLAVSLSLALWLPRADA